MTLKLAKASIRTEVKNFLSAMTNESRLEQSKSIFNMLLALEKYKESKRIGIYLSMPEEVQTDDIVKHLFESGKECFIPRYNLKEMVMVKVNSLDDFWNLPKNKWNIRQPLQSDLREDAITKGGLDFIIVPGLAFTESGCRLGRGKGYYDRFLNGMHEFRKNNGKEMFTVGLAFKEQILHTIPMETTDYILNQILHNK